MSNSKRKYYVLNLLKPNILRHKKLLAGSTCLAAVIGSGWLLQGSDKLAFWWTSPKQTSNESPNELPSYIYVSTRPHGHDSDTYENSTRRFWLTRPNIRLHWKLMNLSKSKHRNVRYLAVKALADLPAVGDAECLEVAQASDIHLSVTLARTPGIDQRFFLPPPRTPSQYMLMSSDALLRCFLSQLPSSDDKSCIQYFNSLIGVHHNEWHFGLEDDPNTRARRVPVKTVFLQGLRALIVHSLIPQHRLDFVRYGGLIVLHRVCQENATDAELQSLAAQILGNLAIDKLLHKQIFMSGWIGILAKWTQSQDIKLALPASRALANMETEHIKNTYFDEGIYVLHPPYRDKEIDMHADVVFIHGLLGGAFKTWRQDDSQSTQQQMLSNVFPGTEVYTHCWPKDWLARDCPNLRLLSLDYESQLSDWRASCPPGSQRHSLKSRSKEMARKLIVAGVGERPVVWVTHSMGGLIVKEMLVNAAESNDPKEQDLLRQTRGIVFYGVPHRGCALANLNISARLLLLPSAEVRELRESPSLLLLNDKFKELVAKHKIMCLSFAETKGTHLGLNWKTVLVTPDSADLGSGEFHKTESDHLNICKPSSRQSPSYSFLLKFLHKCIHTNIMEKSMVMPDVDTAVAMGLVQ